MNVNELRAQRAEAINQAAAITTTAEAEGRELTAAEMAQIDGLIGVEDGSVPNRVATLDAQIARVARVSTLQAQLSRPTTTAVKPDPTNAARTMKRTDWNKLPATEQAAFLKNGGKLED